MGVITLGLAVVKVAPASPSGVMPDSGSMTKIGKVYQGTCNINQDQADVNDFFEEGKAVPEVRRKKKKTPLITFGIMDPDTDALAAYVGGESVPTTGKPYWGYDGDEIVANVALSIETEQGLNFQIPNCDIDGIISGGLNNTDGIFLLSINATPLAVAAGKAFRAVPKPDDLEVSPTSLLFDNNADAVGKSLTIDAPGDITSIQVPSEIEWCIVTATGKVATVTVTENESASTRSTFITLVSGGAQVQVGVTQTGVAIG